MSTHGIGVVKIGEWLPDPVVVLFVILTQLGDLWFYFLVLSTIYLSGDRLPGLRGTVDRRRAAYLVALALGAAALTTALKGTFAVPRPPGAATAELADLFPAPLRGLYAVAATADGHSFPSGHATGAAVVWVGAATVVGVGSRRARYGVAGAVACLVALSRVVIGVHFAVDVVVGLVLGLLYLAVANRLSDRGARPGRGFSLALAVALAGVLLVGFEFEPVALLGAALGARVVWGALGASTLAGLASASRREGAVNLTVGLVGFGGLFGLVSALEPAPPLAFAGGALVLGGLLGTPLVGEFVEDRLG